MNNYLLAILLQSQFNCPPAELRNHTSSWTRFDQSSLDRAADTCYTKYRGQCLVRFEKLEERKYNAICGKR